MRWECSFNCPQQDGWDGVGAITVHRPRRTRDDQHIAALDVDMAACCQFEAGNSARHLSSTVGRHEFDHDGVGAESTGGHENLVWPNHIEQIKTVNNTIWQSMFASTGSASG